MISKISFDNWTQNSQCSVHSHYTINIADSSLKQNACHVLVNLATALPTTGFSVAQR